jgi:hypothetical protein
LDLCSEKIVVEDSSLSFSEKKFLSERFRHIGGQWGSRPGFNTIMVAAMTIVED